MKSSDLRQISDIGNTLIASALEWITAYVENSAQVDSKYLKTDKVESILAPLYYILPKPVITSGVYRILNLSGDFKKGDLLSLKPKSYVVSWTLSNNLKDWLQIADDIGIDTDNAFVVYAKQVQPLTSPYWIKQIQEALSPYTDYGDFLYDMNRRAFSFFDLDPYWQNEVIAKGTAVKVKVIASLSS